MRRTWDVTVVLAAGLALAACGGGDDESADSTIAAVATTAVDGSMPATTAAAVSTAPTASTAPVTTAPVVGTTAPGTVAITTVPVSTTAPTSNWQDPTGTFTIAFPAEPAVQELQAPLPDGTSLPVTAYLAEVDGAAVIASCVVYPEGTAIDPTVVLDSARDGALANVGADLVDSQPIELQGRPGVSYRGVIGEAGGVLARTYLDGLQLCQALVVGEPAIIDEVAPAFLDSFQFLKEAA